MESVPPINRFLSRGHWLTVADWVYHRYMFFFPSMVETDPIPVLKFYPNQTHLVGDLPSEK